MTAFRRAQIGSPATDESRWERQTARKVSLMIAQPLKTFGRLFGVPRPIGAALARRRYFACYPEMTGITTALDHERGPADRGRLLYRLAELEAELAGLHPTAFGPDPIVQEGGRDLSVSLATSAEVLAVYAETELAALIAIEDGGEWPGDVVGEMALDMGASSAEADLWCDLAVTRDRGERAALMDRIWPHVADRAGGQAAESFACLISAETARPRRRRPFPRPSRTVITIAFTAVALLIVVPGLPKLPGMRTGHLHFLATVSNLAWFAVAWAIVPALAWTGREINRLRRKSTR